MLKTWLGFIPLFILLCFAIPASAQTLSYSCQAVNTWDGTQLFFNGFQMHNLDFNAGEQISLTPGATYMNAPATEIHMELNGVLVATNPIPGTLTYTFPADINVPTIMRITFVGTATSVEIAGSCISTSSIVDKPVPVFTDGRINNRDGAAPVALYGVADSDGDMRLDIYAADESGLLLSIPAEIISAVAECPDSNTLIYHDDTTGISLYRLPQRSDDTCPFQLNAPATEPGKTYVIIFDTLYMNTRYESYETRLE